MTPVVMIKVYSIQTDLGTEAVFYSSAFLILTSIAIMMGSTISLQFSKLIRNPIILSAIVGLAIYIFHIPLPTFS